MHAHTTSEIERETAMGSEAQPAEQSRTTSIPILPLVLFSSISPPPSPEPSGTLTPPLHSATAAVPFRWEQEPGKPKHSTAIVAFSNATPTIDSSPKSLGLPPRLVILENPHGLGSSNRFRSPSLRMGTDCYGSFGAERPVRAVIRSRGWVGFGWRGKGWWFGSWRMKKREVSGGSHVFPSWGADNRDGSDVNRVKMKRSGVWTTMYEGLKQMVPWRSKKLKKDGYALRL